MTAMARPALLYFLLWLGVTLSAAMHLEKRIIGGHDCPDAEYQFHVKLIATSFFRSRYRCGGSLISPQWVLTAAHCWKTFGWGMKAYVNIHPNTVPTEEIDVIDHRFYREAGFLGFFRKHDIMLVRLRTAPQNINPIPTVQIPTQNQCDNNDINVGNVFQVAGLGLSAINPQTRQFLNQFPANLQCLNNVPVIQCPPNYIARHRPRIPVANAFCAHTTQPPLMNTAGGDSGGGVLFNDRIYGIVAGGHATHAFVSPFYFVRVCSYRAWIEQTVGP